MTKAELVAKIAKEAKITLKTATDVIESIMKAVTTEEKVVLTGFGTFEHKARAAKIGRNPQTGETIPIPAKTVIAFKASKQLVAEVQ